MSLKSKLEHSLAISLMASSLVFASGCRSTGNYCCSQCDRQTGLHFNIQRAPSGCGCDGGSAVAASSDATPTPNAASKPMESDAQYIYAIPPTEIAQAPKVDTSSSSNRKTFNQGDAAPPVPAELRGDAEIQVDDPKGIQAEPLSAQESVSKNPTPVATERDSGDLKNGWEVPTPVGQSTLTAPADLASDSTTDSDATPKTETPVPLPVDLTLGNSALLPASPPMDDNSKDAMAEKTDADQYNSDKTNPNIATLDGNGGEKVAPPLALVSTAKRDNGPIILRAKVVQPLIRPLPFDVRQSDGKRLNPGKPISYVNPGNPADQDAGSTAPFAVPASSAGTSTESNSLPGTPDLSPAEKVSPPMKSASALMKSTEPNIITLKATPKASEVDSLKSQKPFFTEPMTPMLANPANANGQQN